ncbi:hypothetical protein [Actinoallomurus bryophytorum]|uniref:hypothetical protein n=1 Tax=Actinoallomurus bryophytorum TaxID=1490222 RepID=UPI0011535F9A|nr:hypothetical protein [Actinoallomurus bryophytorum]
MKRENGVSLDFKAPDQQSMFTSSLLAPVQALIGETLPVDSQAPANCSAEETGASRDENASPSSHGHILPEVDR